MLPERFLGERVESFRDCVCFDLAIPGIAVEFLEPLSECGEFVGREFLDLTLNVFDTAHREFPSAILAGVPLIRIQRALDLVFGEFHDALRNTESIVPIRCLLCALPVGSGRDDQQ